uniref:MANSC domain-containing protein n=1 Tax=Meloidogyne hapla TaxID=6305 RepID=A0A1I8BIZ1_MELHA
MLFYCIPNLSFLTSPDKVNGLQGFNFSWTEVLHVQSDSECTGEQFYLCSYSRLCIDAQVCKINVRIGLTTCSLKLRCNGEDNCGENDDSDEAHLKRKNHAKVDLHRKSRGRRKRQKTDYHGARVHHQYLQQSGGRIAFGEASTPRPRQPRARQSKPRQTILDKHRLSGAVTMITRLSEDERCFEQFALIDEFLHLPMYDHHNGLSNQFSKLSPTLEEHTKNDTNALTRTLSNNPEQNIDGNVKIFYG